jgi:hypothetical protein
METNQTTILKALENIHEASKESKLQLEKYAKVVNEIRFVSDYFLINEIQGIILSSFISLSCLDEIELIELIKYFEMEKIEFLPFIHHLEILEDKNILGKRSNRHFSREDYFLKPHLIEYIVGNKIIPIDLIKTEEKEDTFHQFLGEIDVLSNKKDKEEIDYRFFTHQFGGVLVKYKKFKLVDFALKNLEPIDSFVFFDVIIDGIAAGENNFQSSLQITVDDFTNRNRDTFNYISKFLEGKTKLNILNLIEKDKSSFSNKHKIQLTEKAINMLFEMEGLKIGYTNNKNEKLIYPDKIQKTNLFYNDSEQQQLDPVLKSLSHHSFSKLQKRLQDNNMPSGVTALLYGVPGTGKTETVYQLAKKYNRPIFKVEIAETKSMWFGESQKLVKKKFTDYYQYKKKEKVCPILLFNEADAVIGKRKSAGSSSVADTENAIQNILLEELENFDGILFATSNLVNNLDAAFERRFLFKIKFETPSLENAAKIWRSKLPTITKKEAEILAFKFKLSGGEMENIARKCIMEEVVLENKLTFGKIKSFCENEKWDKNTNNIKIGF